MEEQHGTYSVYPQATHKDHHYPMFAISDTEGLVDAGSEDDETFFLDLYISPSSIVGLVPAQPADKKPIIHYRIPALCSVKLSSTHQILFNTQLPVYQLGHEETCPAK